jgi:Na+/melibiose symporter-like transporter
MIDKLESTDLFNVTKTIILIIGTFSSKRQFGFFFFFLLLYLIDCQGLLNPYKNFGKVVNEVVNEVERSSKEKKEKNCTDVLSFCC